MATMKMPCAVGGGSDMKYAVEYVGTVSTAKITTGFKPKYLIVSFGYSSGHQMTCYYNEEVSTSSYQRIYGATSDTQPLPNSNTGLHSVDNDGFTLDIGYNVCSYIAIG